MHRLTKLKKPTKIFIIIMLIITIGLICLAAYSEVSDYKLGEAMSRFFTGDTESEISVDEVIPYKKQEVKDENLNEGTSEIRQEGKDGKKKIIFRVTKDKDGNEINRNYIGEEVIDEAVDEIVAIGTKVPAPANNNYSQSGWSNSGGTQSYSNSGNSQPSGNSPQSSSNNSQPSDNKPSSSNQGPSATSEIHYCTNPNLTNEYYTTKQNDHRYCVHMKHYYIKTNYQCGQTGSYWDRYNIEVSSDEYYSYDLCNPDVPKKDVVLEARCESRWYYYYE
ncbi:G5 domain-containing protein [Candidatus Saccharibacteria bacterium]|nr:G5 domain-containing protein [Candidatus Saccharibacteria bacterium]